MITIFVKMNSTTNVLIFVLFKLRIYTVLTFDPKIRSSNRGHCLHCLILMIVRLAGQPIGVLGEVVGEHDRLVLLIVHPVIDD